MKQLEIITRFMPGKIRTWVKIMKITVFLCFAGIFSVMAEDMLSQDAKLSIKMENVTINRFFSEIERNSDYVFLFSDDVVSELNNTINTSFRNTELSKILDTVLENTDLSYLVTGRQVIVFKEKTKDRGIKVELQEKSVTGKVFDEKGEPLPGASIVVKGTTRGVMTDIDGSFSINVRPEDELEISFVGYQNYSVLVGNQTEINVKLLPLVNELDEVTVVAFGRQKKESVISSITTVSTKDLKVPSSNLTTAFAGRVAGLISYQTSGEPGQDNANFFIRGITTFGADAKKDPLILIDGVELTTDDLARLNTDDIASFSIMKDATATALYGARGANGVILVTTKEGREGRAQVNLRLENSFSSPTKMVDLADPITYMKMHNEAVLTRDPNGVRMYSAEKIAMTQRGTYPDIYPATDWYKSMFRNVISNQRANMSVSGGGKVARYYVAANIAQDNGNLKVDDRNDFNSNINLTKYAVRSNVNVNVTKTTELILRLSSTFDEYRGPIDGGSDMYRKVMQANPVYFKPSYEPDEHFSYVSHVLFGNYGTANYINPYAQALRGYRDYSKNMTMTQFEVKQNLNMLAKGLSFRAMVNMNRFSEFTVNREYSPFYYSIDTYDLNANTYTLKCLNPAGGDTYLNYSPGSRNINTVFYLESAMEYNTEISEKHSLNALLVYIMRQEKKGIADNLQLSLPNRNLGISGRVAYNYDSRYFAEFNFGYNGSERFAKKHRWGFFPSIGVAWMLSNEAFFDPLKNVFPQFKLKATYGMVGNDAIGSNNDRFYYLSQVNMNASKNVNWGSSMNYNPGGISVTRYANDQIGWETAYKTNIGAEISVIGGFSANIDFFHERRENILLDRVIPNTMGIIPNIKANLGVATGKGVDMELNYEKVFSSDFFLTGRGTFTYATSKIKEWEEPDYADTPWRSRVGHNINQQYGYIAERLFVDEMEVANSPTQFGNVMGGDIKYRDVNGDGSISTLDLVPIGYPTVPEINYGFGLTVGYKGFDFSFFFQGSARQSFWLTISGNGNIQPFVDGNSDDGLVGQNAVLQEIADNYWTEGNRNPYAFWPRLSTYAITNNNQTSTWFMQDATFLRLKSAEIGYSLPQNLIKKLFMSNLRVYVSGTNLLCWSRFKLWDPEMAGQGLGYPLQRVINVGLNIGF
ncbi:MAG: TonB-dependent receptor [Bacteroidales bacterium]|jgi:TonB-linked SusC/RagA family outer membrane protein|nr:TonB-dependent receptor [Bacteroidales bacterium]